MKASMFVMSMLVTMVTAGSNGTVTVDPCDNCPPGEVGPKGLRGHVGIVGTAGDSGSPGRVYYRGTTTQCGSGPCPTGVPGDAGGIGAVGEIGEMGEPGSAGPKGVTGNFGEPGLPGPSGSLNGDVMYLPYIPGDQVGQVCYTFRKSCLVPGLRNGWRGWYKKGESGYMIYNKWMYFVTLSDCPCEYDLPGPPQPVKPSDCHRTGECE